MRVAYWGRVRAGGDGSFDIDLAVSDSRHRIEAALDQATYVVVVDPVSFPWEWLRAPWPPIAAYLPTDIDPDVIMTLLRDQLFSRPRSTDRIGGADAMRHAVVPQVYSCAQWIPSDSPHGFAGAALREHDLSIVAESYIVGDPKAPIVDLATPIMSARREIQRGLVAAAVSRAAELRPDGIKVSVLVVGVESGTVPRDLLSAGAEVTCFDMDLASIEDSKFRYGDLFDCRRLGGAGHLDVQTESFDLALVSNTFSRLGRQARGTLMRGVWRAVVPGGRILVLDRFVGNHVVSVDEFWSEFVLATGYQVVVAGLDAVRFEGEDMHTHGLIECSRLGVPQRW